MGISIKTLSTYIKGFSPEEMTSRVWNCIPLAIADFVGGNNWTVSELLKLKLSANSLHANTNITNVVYLLISGQDAYRGSTRKSSQWWATHKEQCQKAISGDPSYENKLFYD